MACWLRKRGPAGRFLLVTPCFRVCHRESMRCGVHGRRTYSGRRPCRQDGRCAPSAFPRTATDGPRWRRSGLTRGRRVGRASPCARPAARWFPGGGRGRAGARVARAAVRESVTVAGRAERARVARAFTVGVLGPGHPCGDDAALLVSELFGNSVRHSGSGAAGQTVTVAVWAADGVVRVEVTDRSGLGCRSCGPLMVTRKVAGGWGWWRGWPRGGAGGGVAGGR